MKIVLKNIAPPLQENIAARQMRKTQMEQEPAAPDSPGAVRSPIPVRTEVSGGWRAKR